MKECKSQLRLRINFGNSHVFGPGKADLLTLIHDTGSISKAAKSMSMSYKRAWSLVEEMNDMFAEPLVITQRGGAGRGGAVLTKNGIEVLEHYRNMEVRAFAEGQASLQRIEARLKP